MRRGDAAVIGDVGREALCFGISGGQPPVGSTWICVVVLLS